MFEPKPVEATNQALVEARSDILNMGGLVSDQIGKAVAALVTQDVELAEQVVEADHEVNALEKRIDESCIDVISSEQLQGAELRLAITILKVIGDLERIGDEAERVARRVFDRDSIGIDRISLGELEHLGELVRANLDKALDSFARNDPQLAYKTFKRDNKIDQKYSALTRQLTTFMAEDARNIGPSLAALWAARALERAGDRSQNICEYVIYLVGGTDVRHVNVETVKAAAKRAD